MWFVIVRHGETNYIKWPRVPLTKALVSNNFLGLEAPTSQNNLLQRRFGGEKCCLVFFFFWGGGGWDGLLIRTPLSVMGDTEMEVCVRVRRIFHTMIGYR